MIDGNGFYQYSCEVEGDKYYNGMRWFCAIMNNNKCHNVDWITSRECWQYTLQAASSWQYNWHCK